MSVCAIVPRDQSVWKSGIRRECSALFFCVNIYHTGKRKESNKSALSGTNQLYFRRKQNPLQRAYETSGRKNSHAISEQSFQKKKKKSGRFKTKGVNVAGSGFGSKRAIHVVCGGE